MPGPKRSSVVRGLLLCGGLLLAGYGGHLSGQVAGQGLEHPGMQPVTPTTLQWFALETQAHYGRPLDETGLSVRFVPRAPDTIVVELTHLPQAGVERIMERYVASVERAARVRNYDWLKIEQKFEQQELGR